MSRFEAHRNLAPDEERDAQNRSDSTGEFLESLASRHAHERERPIIHTSTAAEALDRAYLEDALAG